MLYAYKEFWARWKDFSGTSDRPDFWWAFLANAIISLVLGIGMLSGPASSLFGSMMASSSDEVAMIDGPTEFSDMNFGLSLLFGGLFLLYTLLSFIPSLSLTVRRLRDAGFSPWFVVLNFVGFSIVVLVLAMLPTKYDPYAHQGYPHPPQFPHPPQPSDAPRRPQSPFGS